jgi:hydrogenase maturation protein HypF
MPVPRSSSPTGGHLKNGFCLTGGKDAFRSHHNGDLEDYWTYRAFVEGIDHVKGLFDVAPLAVAHDLHPGYLSSRYALSLGDLPRIAVQHHHAHIASCMAENGCEGPLIGVAWDGTDYGTGGRPCGGEFLVPDFGQFERLPHLKEVPLPGGEQAIRQPWRMAAAYLQAEASSRTSVFRAAWSRVCAPADSKSTRTAGCLLTTAVSRWGKRRWPMPSWRRGAEEAHIQCA